MPLKNPVTDPNELQELPGWVTFSVAAAAFQVSRQTFHSWLLKGLFEHDEVAQSQRVMGPDSKGTSRRRDHYVRVDVISRYLRPGTEILPGIEATGEEFEETSELYPTPPRLLDRAGKPRISELFPRKGVPTPRK